MTRRPRDTQRVTLSVPTKLLDIADVQGERLGIDRFDILKLALGQGLMLMDVQQRILDGQLETKARDIAAAMNQISTTEQASLDNFADDVADSVSADLDARPKPLPKKKGT